MKLVIDIPDKIYNTFQRGNWSVTYSGKKIRDIVMNGIPLPEGHVLDTIVLLNEIEAENDKAYDDLDGYDPYALLGTFANIVAEIIDKYREKCKIKDDKQNK